VAPKLEKLAVVDAMNLSGIPANPNVNLPGAGMMGGNVTSGLTLFLEKVRSIRELSLVGNFDPFSSNPLGNAPPLLQLPNMGGFGTGLPPVIPITAQLFGNVGLANANPLPVQTMNFAGGTGLPLLRAMKDIEKMEVLSIHPKFAEALYTMRLEADGDVDGAESPEEIAVEEEESDGDTAPEASTTVKEVEKKSKPVKLHNTFSYLPNLRRLEFTVSKTVPLTRQDFNNIFSARCWVERKDEKANTLGSEEEDEATPRGPDMRSLEKLEVHLGAGLEEDLTDAVNEKMVLEGEEKGCRWFSWTHPDFANET